MAEKAGIKGKYTNHSGKRSCATTLFQNGVDQHVQLIMAIMGRTGHRSNAVRVYKHPSQTQQRHASELLDPPKKAVKVEPEETKVKNIHVYFKLNRFMYVWIIFCIAYWKPCLSCNNALGGARIYRIWNEFSLARGYKTHEFQGSL